MQTQAPAAEPSPTLGGGLSPLPLQKPPHPPPPADQRPSQSDCGGLSLAGGAFASFPWGLPTSPCFFPHSQWWCHVWNTDLHFLYPIKRQTGST